MPTTNFFNEDIAAKATILAGQSAACWKRRDWARFPAKSTGARKFLPMWRMRSTERQMLSAVIEALADRLRLLLRTQLVCVLLRREGPFELKAVSADTPQLATSARARHDRQTLRFAADLAQRAVAAAEPITLSIGADVHSLGKSGVSREC